MRETDASFFLPKQAEAGFRLTFDTLTKIFAIQTSVVVQAVFRSFCIPLNEANTGSDGECSLKSALGQAGAAAYWLGRVERNSTSATDPLIAEQYLYPQALVKQFAKDVNVEWNEVDLLAEFNADANFWFPVCVRPFFPFCDSMPCQHGPLMLHRVVYTTNGHSSNSTGKSRAIHRFRPINTISPTS